VLLVVDVQERLLPHIHNRDDVVQKAGLLIDGFHALQRPIVVTEQYRKGLGPTVSALAEKLGEPGPSVHEKLKFSACIGPVRRDLDAAGARSVLVCGIEAHVCVLQTCLDLADQGLTVAVALDAIGSRRASDQAAAQERMIQAGIVPTTAESALLELVHEAGTDRFRRVLPLLK